MKRFINYFYFFIVILAGFSSRGYALEFRAGSYYFDNSKLHFDSVKFVIGNDTITHVFDMTPDSVRLNWLQATLNNDISDLTGYCFIESDTIPGTYDIGLTDFIEEITNIDTCFRQTKIREDIKENFNRYDRIIGWVFCPLNDAPQSDGYWRPTDSYDVEPSRTVPLVHINTQDSIPITSKDYYINGQIWIENCNVEGFESLASEEEPLDLEIKGRGNVTWLVYYKKPYKIKLSRKESPLGLDRSKHFILVPRSQDYDGYVRNTTGFELSRLLEMEYTPSEVPVELILNDDEINRGGDTSLDFTEFLQAGGVLRWNDSKQLMHDKFCIIDDRIVITGSYNWTNKAELNSEVENFFYDEEETTEFYNGLFEKLSSCFEQEPTEKIPDQEENGFKGYIDVYVKGKINSTLRFPIQQSYYDEDGCFIDGFGAKYSHDKRTLIKGVDILLNYGLILKSVTEKNEPSILAHYLLELAQKYTTFYNEDKVMVEDEKVKKARAYLTYCVQTVIKIGCRLLGMEMPSKM